MSAVSKMIRCKVASIQTFLPISPSYTLYSFSQEHRITSAHMEKLDYFLGSHGKLDYFLGSHGKLDYFLGSQNQPSLP